MLQARMYEEVLRIPLKDQVVDEDRGIPGAEE